MAKRQGNLYGGAEEYKTRLPIDEEMDLFDNLSPRLRNILREAPYKFSAEEIVTSMLNTDATEDEIIEALKGACRRVFNEQPYGTGD